MSGLLGYLKAAGAGAAGAAMDVYKRNHEFDLRMELMDAEEQKALRLKEMGIALEERYDAKKRQERSARMKEAYGPEDTRGGWQSDEAKEAEATARDEAAARKLESMGYADEAEPIYKRLDRNRKAELDAEKVSNAFTQGSERLRLQGENVRLQGELAEWKMRGGGSSSGGKKGGLTASQQRSNDEQALASEDLAGWGYTSSNPIEQKNKRQFGGYGRFFTKDGEYITEFDTAGNKNPEFSDMKKKYDKANRPYLGESKEAFAARKKAGDEAAGVGAKRPAKPAQSSGSGDISSGGVVLKFDSQGNLIK